MFIYAFARAWCEQNGYELCLDPWIGEKIFQIPEANRTRNADKVFPENYYQDQDSLIYTRRQVREWFKLKPEIEERLQPVLNENRKRVLCNARWGVDYVSAGNPIVRAAAYEMACAYFGYSMRDIEWEIDTKPTRLLGFNGDIWGSGQGVTAVALPSFYRLMKAPILFRANSTFSWWAATLGDGKVFSPVVKGMKGECCPNFIEGNWPQMTTSPVNTDLFLRED